jgi:hypothetical protein
MPFSRLSTIASIGLRKRSRNASVAVFFDPRDVTNCCNFLRLTSLDRAGRLNRHRLVPRCLVPIPVPTALQQAAQKTTLRTILIFLSVAYRGSFPSLSRRNIFVRTQRFAPHRLQQGGPKAPHAQ